MKQTENSIRFILDDNIVLLDMMEDKAIRPDTSLLNYLRHIGHASVKEGCGEGDCGACTVVIAGIMNGALHYKAINSCLVLLPMIHGYQVITTENLSYYEKGKLQLHPVQQAIVDHHGSQCGYCTPGIVMSLFALWKEHTTITLSQAKERLAGNLCRCTGYQAILEAILDQSKKERHDHFTDSADKIMSKLASIRESSGDMILQSSGLKYYKPMSLKSALQLRSEHPESTIISGATDMAVAVNKRKLKLSSVLDISSVEELKFIQEENRRICISSGISIEDMGEAIKGEFPALHEMISLFGSHQIRNLATPAGNIGSASPIGDLLPVLMAYGCEVVMQNLQGKRIMPLEEFITGYHETRLKSDELITDICLPMPGRGQMIRSYKISKRKDVDISSVSAAFSLVLKKDSSIEKIRLYYGGMAASIVRAKEAEQFLSGKKWTEENAIQAAELIRSEFEPISDARSGAKGRKIMAGNLLIRFWEDTNNENNG